MNSFKFLLLVFVAFIAAILWYYHNCSSQTLLVVAFGFFCLQLFITPLKKTALRGSIIAIAGFIFGIIIMRFQTDQYTKHLRSLQSSSLIHATIKSCESTPNGQYPTVIIATDKQNNNLQLFIPEICAYYPGDTIRAQHTPYSMQTNDSFQQYLQKEGIHASWFLKKGMYIIQQSQTWSLEKLLYRVRERITKSLNAKMSSHTKDLCMLILFGHKTCSKNTRDAQQEFTLWGTTHQLARSGLHVILFVALWGFLLAALPCSFFLQNILLLALIAVYFLISWPGIAFIRACIMIFLYTSLKIAKLPVYPLYIILLTCLILLIHNPLQLFFLDFQLSFFLTAAILIFFNQTHLQLKNH